MLTYFRCVGGRIEQHQELRPELHWRYGYLWAVFLMLSVPIGIVLWFRKQGWL